MADDKVVIGSNEGVPVRPGDLTKVTSVINTDSAADDSIATASIPRMKMKSGLKSDSAETSTIDKAKIQAKLEEDKPKKKTTVKLKPLVVGETGKETAAPSQPSPNAISTPAPAPTAAHGTSVPRVASEDETAKIKTRPAIASASVAAESSPAPLREPASPSAMFTPAPAPTPAHATAVPKIASEDETVKIQKPRAFVASTAVPGVKQTIKLRPSSTTPAPVSDADSSAGPSPQPPQAPQPSLAVTPSQAPVAPPAPVLAGASEAKRTIRLVPKKSDATSGGEHSSTTSKPSAPTIKLEEPKPVPAESSRSAATINLSSTSDGVEPTPAGSLLKRTLKLKSTRPPEATTVTPRPIPPQASASSAAAPMPVQAAPMPVPPPAVAAATDSEIAASSAGEEREIPSVKETKVKKEKPVPSAYEKQEPSIIFTIAACIALFVMAYFTWMLVGQYCNNYTDTKISVPGLSGKVK